MESEEARKALQEVDGRKQQVAAELARQYPPLWSSVAFVLGYYVFNAGIDFDNPVPLWSFLAGVLLMGGGLLVGAKAQARSGVKGPRDMWDTGTIWLTVAWVVGMAVLFQGTRFVLLDVVADGVTSAVAAVPATVVCALMVRWLYRRAFVVGVDQASQEGQASQG